MFYFGKNIIKVRLVYYFLCFFFFWLTHLSVEHVFQMKVDFTGQKASPKVSHLHPSSQASLRLSTTPKSGGNLNYFAICSDNLSRNINITRPPSRPKF